MQLQYSVTTGPLMCHHSAINSSIHPAIILALIAVTIVDLAATTTTNSATAQQGKRTTYLRKLARY